MSLREINKKIKVIELLEKLKTFERNERARSLVTAKRKLNNVICQARITQAELDEVDSMRFDSINSHSIFSFEQRTKYALFLHLQKTRIAIEIDKASNTVDDMKIEIDRLIKQNDFLFEKKKLLKMDQKKIINEKHFLYIT